ncbi:hypothetical protein SPOG_05640 [Schizosaccharomyces cryophilus OY26]|uniref:Uncharacterized protein n=1 Tax=Schizosaccharomyces cryophilus (strain OY26 / ATCC MYA-4695 / CBS 11777 / NBRC 106824 / NRRL Y48691) TaxID=653667 RepID=S9VZA8_SCHCR|nr:uncharacterized protein SPOG_05640 [Schizosaccharomyces cryophilus OY26]EPY52963.1 hypothetical protein SPOG_05640 [Schizosaccharomyces cryophilus OY26]
MKNLVVQRQRFLQSIHKPTYLQRPGSALMVYPYYAAMGGITLLSVYFTGKLLMAKKD